MGLRDGRMAILAGAWSLGSWLVLAGSYYAVLRSLGVASPGRAAVLSLVVTNLVQVIPASAASLGVFEAAGRAAVATYGGEPRRRGVGGGGPARHEHPAARRTGGDRHRPRGADAAPARAGGTRPGPRAGCDRRLGGDPLPRRGGHDRRVRALRLGRNPRGRRGRRGDRGRQRLGRPQRGAGPDGGGGRRPRGRTRLRQRLSGRDPARARRVDPDGRRRRHVRLRRAAPLPGGGARRRHGDGLAPAGPHHAGGDAVAPSLHRKPRADRYAEPALRRGRLGRALRPADGAARGGRPHRPAHDGDGVRVGDDHPGRPGRPRDRRDADHLRRAARGQPLEAALGAGRPAPRALHARLHERRPDLGARGRPARGRRGPAAVVAAPSRPRSAARCSSGSAECSCRPG